MPTLVVNTNVPQSRVDNSDTLKALSQTMTAQLGKPETYVEIVLHCGVPMMFGGTEEPAAFCELICLGVIGGDKNKSVSAAVMGVLQQKLGVPPNRTYIRFNDPARSDFGWNMSTFG